LQPLPRSRRAPRRAQAQDLEYAQWLGAQGLPFSLVFTKADKRKKGAPTKSENVAGFCAALLQGYGFRYLPPTLLTSSAKGLGKGELLGHIASVRVLFEQGVKRRGGLPPLPQRPGAKLGALSASQR
jgi:hypothetical protein